MNSIVLKSLSILLGLFFIFVGTLKVSSMISKELHKDLRREYVKYAKVFPFVGLLGIKIAARWYRRVVGLLEIFCGIGLTFIPSSKIKQGANVVLLTLMILAIYSQYMIDDKFERMAPTLVFLFMLTGRLVIFFQLQRNMKREGMAGNGDVPVEEKARKTE